MSPFFQWKKSLWFWKVSNLIIQVKRGRDLLVLKKYVFDWITPQPLIDVGANLIKNDNISYNMSYRHVCFAFFCLSVYFVGCFVCFAFFFFFLLLLLLLLLLFVLCFCFGLFCGLFWLILFIFFLVFVLLLNLIQLSFDGR